MATHEKTNGADNWYTQKWIIDSLDCNFTLDPCSGEGDFVNATNKYYENGLDKLWTGSVWLNPPFGDKRLQIQPWLEKFVNHGNGIAIVPNRTATDWWQEWAESMDYLVFLKGKVKFIKDGDTGKSPGYGNVLGAIGLCADVLFNAGFEGLKIDRRSKRDYLTDLSEGKI